MGSQDRLLAEGRHLSLMGRTPWPPEEGDRALRQLRSLAGKTTVEDVIALLGDSWRYQVIGAWMALLTDDRRVTEAVLGAVRSSQGSLTSPPLAVVSVVLAGERAVPSLADYLEHDLDERWGAAGFVAAAIEAAGGVPVVEPAADDRYDYERLQAVAIDHRSSGRRVGRPS